jgi:hypothetical protein
MDIPLVGIKMPHPLLPDSESFPWPSESLFVNGRAKREHDFFEGCNAWVLAKRAGVWGGCGNHNQAQIARKVELPQGVWQLQADGWVQIA